ncbi:DUF6516 family protein [Ferrovibrio terrae]|uniref:toxin-antitoxin system TumE family protein n=1 Tax=Ferrovibrio terrae TaxID=2594003 RepID=UPI003137E354
MLHHMVAADLYYHLKSVYPDGSVIEMIVWKVPEPVAGSEHGFKYRLFFGRAGTRIVGYDNERGKGDHKHIKGKEMPYRFTTPEALIADFIADVRNNGGRTL